jgi:sulfoxide reductase heme-binding subunit YedZ
MTAPRPGDHAWWLASRASGLVAFALLTAAVLAGLMLGGRLARRPGLALALRVVHEHAAVAGLIAVGVHGATLLGDTWLRPGLSGVLVPGAIGYRPLAVGAGIVAAYLAAALGLSFPLRRRIGQRRWKTAHRFTLLAYALAVGHAVAAGTDVALAWVRRPVMLSAAAVLVLTALRVEGGRRAAAATRAKVAAAQAARPDDRPRKPVERTAAAR